MKSIQNYVRANRMRLAFALLIVGALAVGIIDPASAAVGGLILNTTLDDIGNETRAALAKIRGQVDGFCSAQKERTGGLDEKTGELQARLLEVEQKLARRGDAGAFTAGVYGTNSGDLRALLNASTDLQAVAQRKLKRAVIELPGDFFKAQIVSGGGLALPGTHPGIVSAPTRRMTIRALIPSVPTDAGSIQYLREIGFDNQAGTVSETIQKPESDITFELKTATVVTIAHWIRCSAQVLADTPALQLHIDGRLRYGVAFVEETQLLKGSGSGNNLEGMMTAATAFSGAASGNTRIDALRAAITQLATTDFSASGIVMHPTDWEVIQLMKDTTGRYIVGDPSGANPPMLWNLPVIPTAAMTQGDFLVGDFQQSALIFDREQSRVDISTEDGDNFTTNRATIRGEERLGLAILRPGGLIKGSF